MTHIDFEHLPAIASMSPITLGEMESIRLMNRIDTKYVTTERRLVEILQDASAAGYRVFEICGRKVQDYDSVYYDTPGLEMYRMHHSGRKVREKVRVRTYMTGETFLEIKHKNNRGRTKKKRTAIPSDAVMDFGRCSGAAEYLASHSWWTAPQLSPEAGTSFRRITLVNPAGTERLTIDTCLSFTNFRHGSRADLADAVIIELKQDGRASSQMKGILLEHRVFPARISKYCFAVALTEPGVSRGRFKQRIRYVEKMTNTELI